MIKKTIYSYVLIQGIGCSMAEYSRHFLCSIGDRMSYSREGIIIDNWILNGWINKYNVKVFQKTREEWSS